MFKSGKNLIRKQFVGVLILLFAMLLAVGCTANNTDSIENLQNVSETDKTVLGEGENSFILKVIDAEGKETLFDISTEKTIVGEALQELELISGDEGPYGLYVKTVNGITLDYDKDGKYWALYINGEYATSGIDKTEITENTVYTLKAE